MQLRSRVCCTEPGYAQRLERAIMSFELHCSPSSPTFWGLQSRQRRWAGGRQPASWRTHCPGLSGPIHQLWRHQQLLDNGLLWLTTRCHRCLPQYQHSRDCHARLSDRVSEQQGRDSHVGSVSSLWHTFSARYMYKLCHASVRYIVHALATGTRAQSTHC